MSDTKPSATVLIISNDTMFRSTLGENLLLQGFSPLIAASQGEALALLEKKRGGNRFS